MLLGCSHVLTCTVCIWSVQIPLGVDWALTAWPGTTRYSQRPPTHTAQRSLFVYSGGKLSYLLKKFLLLVPFRILLIPSVE